MKIFKKEREVADLAQRYLGVAEQCLSEAESAIVSYLEGQMDPEGMREAAEGVSRHEREADGIHREMRDKLFSGAYLPLIRGDIFSLFESLDRVPNAAETCTRFFYGEAPDVPGELRAAFVEVTRASFGVRGALRKSVEGFFDAKGSVDVLRHEAQ